jgi:hypothetical protein
MKEPPGYPARIKSESKEKNTSTPDPGVPGPAGGFEGEESGTDDHVRNDPGAIPIGDETQIDENEKRFRYYIAMLEDPDPGRRWKAAESLARLGDDRAVGPLIETLSDEDWRVRQKTAWALGYLGDPAAIPALRNAYRNDLEGVQEMIAEAISMITARMQE